MKRDQNNQLKSANRDFSLPRAKILRGQKNFRRLFQREAVTVHNELVNLRFRLYTDLDQGGCLMGFIVKKKLGKATKRNRIKRLLREAYRLNQYILTPLFEHTSVSFHGVLMATTIEMDFESVQEQVVDLLTRTKESVIPTIETKS